MNPIDGSSKAALDLLRDIKGLQPAASHWLFWMSAAAVILLLVLAIILWWLKGRKKAKPIEIIEPCHQKTLRRLSLLRQHPFHASHDLKQFHFILSDIIRSYIEGEFEVPATDRTTQELRRELAAVNFFSDSHKQEFFQILNLGDQIKFSDIQMSQGQSLELLERVQQFVLSTQKTSLDSPRPNGKSDDQEPSLGSEVRGGSL